MPEAHVLVVNCGSSSIKLALLEPTSGTCPWRALAERLGTPDARLQLTPAERRTPLDRAAGRRSRTGAGGRACRAAGVADRGNRAPRRARRRGVRRERRAGQARGRSDRSVLRSRAAAQPGERRRDPRGAAKAARHRAGRGVRHGVSPVDARARLSVRAAVPALRAAQDPQVRLSRHEPSLRRRGVGRTARPAALGPALDHRAPRQRRQRDGDRARAQRGHDDGANAARRPGDGHAQRRRRSQPACVSGRSRRNGSSRQ